MKSSPGKLVTRVVDESVPRQMHAPNFPPLRSTYRWCYLRGVPETDGYPHQLQATETLVPEASRHTNGRATVGPNIPTWKGQLPRVPTYDMRKYFHWRQEAEILHDVCSKIPRFITRGDTNIVVLWHHHKNEHVRQNASYSIPKASWDHQVTPSLFRPCALFTSARTKSISIILMACVYIFLGKWRLEHTRYGWTISAKNHSHFRLQMLTEERSRPPYGPARRCGNVATKFLWTWSDATKSWCRQCRMIYW